MSESVTESHAEEHYEQPQRKAESETEEHHVHDREGEAAGQEEEEQQDETESSHFLKKQLKMMTKAIREDYRALRRKYKDLNLSPRSASGSDSSSATTAPAGVGVVGPRNEHLRALARVVRAADAYPEYANAFHHSHQNCLAESQSQNKCAELSCRANSRSLQK